MQFKKLNRTGSESVFRTILNVEGATITTGNPVSVKPTAASIDGVSAVISNAAGDHFGFIGIATEDIANNDYGLVQVNGLVNSVLLSNHGSSITITAGDMLIPGPAGLTSVGVGTAYSGNGALAYNFKGVINVDTATVSAAGYVRGLINVL
jgi:hypothetical protein